ncbi:MAG TPA: hypothetical protein VIH03_07915, partial [Nitrososphaerales archaeon]
MPINSILTGRTLRLLAVAIMLSVLLSRLPALAASSQTDVTNYSTSPEQTFLLKGTGGQALRILDLSQISTSTILLEAKVQVLGSFVTGSGRLSFKGNVEGKEVVLNLNFQIDGAQGLCSTVVPQCRQVNMLPLAYSGSGKASFLVDSREYTLDIMVLIDASDAQT